MGKYDTHLENAKRKLELFTQAKFTDRYSAFLIFYEKAGLKLELATKLFCQAYPKLTADELLEITDKFKNDMLLEMKYQEKFKDFITYFQMYLDVEHSKMAEDGDTKGARDVIKDWLCSVPGMRALIEPKREGPIVKIGSDNRTTTTNVIGVDHRLRLEDLPTKWQELAIEMKEKKLLEQKKDNVIDIKEFEEVK